MSFTGSKPLLVVVALMVLATTSVQARSRPRSDRPILVPANKIRFTPMIPGVSQMVLRGNPKLGPHSALIKFNKGHWNPPHSHSHNMWIVVVSGTLMVDIGKGRKAFGPGSFVYEPAGVKHANGAGDYEDCVFVEQSDGPFDLHWSK